MAMVVVIGIDELTDGTSVVEMLAAVNTELIASAFLSIMSNPARMKSKKLCSVVGNTLNGCIVVVSVTFTVGSLLVSSCGSSVPNNREKKSIESLSSSSLLCCLTCRLILIERRVKLQS